jgi:hypothetical protein
MLKVPTSGKCAPCENLALPPHLPKVIFFSRLPTPFLFPNLNDRRPLCASSRNGVEPNGESRFAAKSANGLLCSHPPPRRHPLTTPWPTRVFLSVRIESQLARASRATRGLRNSDGYENNPNNSSVPDVSSELGESRAG